MQNKVYAFGGYPKLLANYQCGETSNRNVSGQGDSTLNFPMPCKCEYEQVRISDARFQRRRNTYSN
jgi:hypothetical protein